MNYRVEDKYICSPQQWCVIRSRLEGIMERDPNQKGDAYRVRSLYMDTMDNACYYENEAGVDEREKFRIRAYGSRFDALRMEIKQKRHGYCRKEQTGISKENFRRILQGQLPDTGDKRDRVLNKVCMEMAARLLHPVAVIEYERSAYIYGAGNVRITLDRNLSVSDECDAFDREDIRKIPVLPEYECILEVKYDELLPEVIAQLLEISELQRATFSKYYLGRSVLGR